MPARLIYVPEMRVVDRNEVFGMYKPAVEALREEDLNPFLGYWSREETLRKALRNTIKFAIFSHRWGSEEPTFLDMTSEPRKGTLKALSGYQKLTRFCGIAQQYSCELAWSDTCCINKESSAELEEAIQAMFKWYRTANICIAYLACSTNLVDFEKEPWFTRGWTLQELLAPEKMKFYGREWIPLSEDPDDKHPRALDNSVPHDTILTTIIHLTEIAEYDLVDFSPGVFRVQQRLRWAARRTTTRVEDMAYSLIGLFDVSMTITYGEGQRSWFRFMEIILRHCKSWDVFAWAGPCSPYSGAIPRSPQGYGALDVSIHLELRKTLDMGKMVGKVGQSYSGIRGDHSFGMTRHGLCMKIPLIPIDFDREKNIATIHAWAPRSYLWQRSTSQDLNVRVLCREWVPRAESYCLGVVNYSPDCLTRQNTEFEICDGPSMCFLFTLPPDDQSWLRLQTENVIIIENNKYSVRCGCSFETVIY